MRVVVKPWGEENIYVENDKYVFKTLWIKKGERISRQYHPVKDETYFIVNGKALLEINNDKEEYRIEITRENQPIRILPMTIHRLTAITNVLLAEVSTGEQDDIVRLADDYGRISDVRYAIKTLLPDMKS